MLRESERCSKHKASVMKGKSGDIDSKETTENKRDDM
jgi:hypothetical protein